MLSTLKKKIIYINHKFVFQYEFLFLKHFYILCAKKSNIVFFDIMIYLRADLIWLLSFKYLTQINHFDFLILNELEEKTILKLKKQVLQGKFQWSILHKKMYYIKFFNYDGFQNVFVEKVLILLIEPIFEINFVENSFGFRPFYTCHTALHFLSCKIKNSLWVLDCSFNNWFNKIPYRFFFNKFCLRVKDLLILNLIQLGFIFHIFTDLSTYFNDLGVPYRGSIGSIIINIYLNFFDKWINKIKTFYFEGYSMIHYIRYGEIFLISLSISFYLVNEIKYKINKFLKVFYSSLSHFFRINVIHASYGVTFLGHLWKQESFVLKSKVKTLKKKSYLVLKIDLKVIIKLLQKRNICDGSGKVLPLFLYFHFSQKEANVRVNKILSFFCDWFRSASNRRYIMGVISVIFRLSLAKMYAAKFKLKSTSIVWIRGGYFLNKPLGKNKKKNNTIPKILYSKYNQIPAQKKKK